MAEQKPKIQSRVLLTITGKKDRAEILKKIVDPLEKAGIFPEVYSSDSIRMTGEISKIQKAIRSAVKAGVKKSRITLKSILRA